MDLVVKALAREAIRHPWQFVLTLMSIAAGVAVVVGVDIANENALRQFRDANALVNGVATHRITGTVGGIDEMVYTRLKVDGRIRSAAPVISAEVGIAGENDNFTLIGIDPFSDFRIRGTGLMGGASPSSLSWPIYVGDDLADSADSLRLRSADRVQEFRVAGRLAIPQQQRIQGDRLLVSDIAWVQTFLGREGRLDHIELKLDGPEQIRKIESLLPAEARIVDLNRFNSAREDMTRSFRINLTALSLLALVVAIFLVYSSVSFQVTRRQRMLGLLKSVGVASTQVATVLFAETLVLALIGTTAGTVLGILLSDVITNLVTQTVDALYYDLDSTPVQVAPFTLVKSMLVGVGATLVAVAVPVTLTSKRSARNMLMGREVRSGFFPRWSWLMPGAIVCGLLGLCLLWIPLESLVVPFTGLFFLICGMALVVPWLLLRCCCLVSRRSMRSRGLTLKMALLNSGAHVRTMAVALVALSMAVSATLGVGLMISSFRTSVQSWLDGYLRADIYLSSETVGNDVLDPMFIDELRQIPGVRDVSLGRRHQIAGNEGPVTLFVLETGPTGFSGFQLQESVAGDIWQKFHAEGHVLVSEPFARWNDVGAGDQVTLPTGQGKLPFTVAGVYLDYSTDRGLVAMDRSIFSRYYPDSGATAASLYLDPEVNVDDVISMVRAIESAPVSMFVSSNQGLKNVSLAIFDQTFRITDVLNWLTVIVAVAGIVSALMALQLARGREYAMLKVVGFSRIQLGRLVLLETGIAGLFAGIVAVPMGVVLSLALIKVINVRSFGWSMQFDLAPELMAKSVLLALLAALAGGLYPAWRMARQHLPTGLRHE